MILTRGEGKAVLAGLFRDPTELQSLPQHLAELGLTHLEASAVEAVAER
jgi:hypothetical protein